MSLKHQVQNVLNYTTYSGDYLEFADAASHDLNDAELLKKLGTARKAVGDVKSYLDSRVERKAEDQ